MILNVVSVYSIAQFNVNHESGHCETMAQTLSNVASIAAVDPAIAVPGVFFPELKRAPASVAAWESHECFGWLFRKMSQAVGSVQSAELPYVTEADAVRAVQQAYGCGEATVTNIRFLPVPGASMPSHYTFDITRIIDSLKAGCTEADLYVCIANTLKIDNYSDPMIRSNLVDYFKGVAKVATSAKALITDYLIYGTGKEGARLVQAAGFNSIDLLPADREYFYPSKDEVREEVIGVGISSVPIISAQDEVDLMNATIQFHGALLEEMKRRYAINTGEELVLADKTNLQFYDGLKRVMVPFISEWCFVSDQENRNKADQKFISDLYEVCNKVKEHLLSLTAIEVTYNLTFRTARNIHVWSTAADMDTRVKAIENAKADSAPRVAVMEKEEQDTREKVVEEIQRSMDRKSWEDLVKEALDSPFGKYVANHSIQEIANEYASKGLDFEWNSSFADSAWNHEIVNAWLGKYDSDAVTAEEFGELEKELRGYIDESKKLAEKEQRDHATYKELIERLYANKHVIHSLRMWAQASLTNAGFGQTASEIQAKADEALKKFKERSLAAWASMSSSSREFKLSQLKDWFSTGGEDTSGVLDLPEIGRPSSNSNAGTIEQAIQFTSARLAQRVGHLFSFVKDTDAVKKMASQIVRNTSMPIPDEGLKKVVAEGDDESVVFSTKGIAAFKVTAAEYIAATKDSHPDLKDYMEAITRLRDMTDEMVLEMNHAAVQYSGTTRKYELNVVYTRFTHKLAVSLQAMGLNVSAVVWHSLLFKCESVNSAKYEKAFFSIAPILDTFNLCRGATADIEAANERKKEFIEEVTALAISKNISYGVTLLDHAHGTQTARNERLNHRHSLQRAAWTKLLKVCSEEGVRLGEHTEASYKADFDAANNW